MLRFLENVLLTILTVVLVVILMLIIATRSPSNEKEACEELCAIRNSEVRIQVDGVCICQK